MRTIGMLLLAGLVWLAPAAGQAASPHRIGAGANYWVAMDSIDVDDVDEDGLSVLVSYQYRPGLLGWQADLEWLPDRFGEKAYAPAAYLVAGGALYAAAGVGIIHQDGDWADDPFFALKGGLDLEVLPRIYLDISASYRFDSKTQFDDALDDIDTDTLFLGAVLRFGY